MQLRSALPTLTLLIIALLVIQPANATSYPLTIPFGRSWPISVVVDSARGFAYLDATSGDYPPTGFSFGVINVTSHELVKTLALNEVPGPMALDQASGDVYVAGTSSIAILDGSNQTFTRQIEVGRPILSMAHDGTVSRDVFFTSGDSVFALDPLTGRIVGNATVEGGAGGVALDSNNGRLYVGQYPVGAIAVFQASTLAPIGAISLPSCCASQFALDTHTQILIATSGSSSVFMVDASTDRFVKSVQVAPSGQNSTNAIAFDNNTGRVYVATSPGGSIVELDGTSGAVVGTLRTVSQVAGLAIDAKTHELYATDYHQVTVFDASRSRVFLLLLVVGGAVVVVGVGLVYVIIKRRDMRERAEMQGRWRKTEAERPERRA